MSENLKTKTVKGVGWSFVDNIANQGISFLVGLVLANLLTPEEYGIVGIIMIFIAIFNCIVDSGFSSALVRKKDVLPIDYDTIFIANILFSAAIFVLCIFGAPYIASFFNEPQLTMLTRVMGIIVIINGVAIVQRTILVKNIDFKTQTKISLIASISSGAVGIGMALYGLGVWSLVGQQISRQTLNTLFLWIYGTWRPRLKFSVESFKQLFGFGWKLLASGLIDALWREIYQVVIGKCYSSSMLGQYTRSTQFSAVFSSNLTTIVQRVSFPVLSQLQDDKQRLKEGYRKVIKVTMYVTFSCMLMLAAVAHPMINVLIGEKWNEAANMLPIVCFIMMLYPLHSLNLNMLQVQGRSDLFLKLEIIKKVFAVGPILLGIFIDIYYMLWGSVVTGLISYYLNSYYSGKYLKYDFWSQVKDIAPSFLLASVTALIVYAVSWLPLSIYIIFPLQLVVGLIVLLAISEIFKCEEYVELKRILFSAINKLKNGK